MVNKVKRKKKHHITWFDIFNTVLMICLSFVFLYPFWETLVISFSDNNYATSMGLKFWPPIIDLNSYKYVFKQADIWTAYGNTIWRTVVGTICNVFVTYCAGYVLASKELPGKGIITFIMVFTMFFGAGLIPTFLTVKAYGLLGSRWSLIVTGLTSAWNIVIARNYVAGLPMELEEAAVIDGAHPLQVVFQVMFPLSMPIVAVLSLWNAVGHWNAWFDALIYIGNNKKGMVLQTILRKLLVDMEGGFGVVHKLTAAETTGQTVKAATIMVAVVPIICVYPFLQKYFVKGVTVGAIKG